jgi:uncharacterized protein (TIGR03083 family)
MSDLIERHRRACAGFSSVADRVADDQWECPTPCTDWDARALVEHVIGFHEVLLLRPMGVRAHRPRTGPGARWQATADALFAALTEPLPVLGALTTDVVVHTWDLARATGREPELDEALCRDAIAVLADRDLPRDDGMFAAAVRIDRDADPVTRLIACYGRDPAWRAG